MFSKLTGYKLYAVILLGVGGFLFIWGLSGMIMFFDFPRIREFPTLEESLHYMGQAIFFISFFVIFGGIFFAGKYFIKSDEIEAARPIEEIPIQKGIYTLTKKGLATVDLNLLKGSLNLQKLFLEANQLTDIDLTPIQDCLNLKVILLDDNSLETIDLTPLSQCKKLQSLSLSNNKLSSVNLTPLQECSELKKLFIDGNSLSTLDLTPLRQCKNLQVLYTSGNQLSDVDFTPLLECPRLNKLTVDEGITIPPGLENIKTEPSKFIIKG